MQETLVQSLVQEDPICHGATKSVRHNYWASALEPGNCRYWAHEPQLLKSTCPRACAPQEKPPQWEARALKRRVALTRCNYRKDLAAFIEGKGKLTGLWSAKDLWIFIGWVLARKEEESFFLQTGCATVTGCESLALCHKRKYSPHTTHPVILPCLALLTFPSNFIHVP